MARTFLAALLILALVVPSVVPPRPSAADIGVAATDVRLRVIYVLPTGTMNPQLQFGEPASGDCMGGSAANPGRADAYRCIAGNRILDPCFVAAQDLSKLACLQSPWSNQATLLTLTKELPRVDNRPELLTALPWGLELANGDHCSVASTGAGVGLAGERVNYSCQTGAGAQAGDVIGSVDRSQATWRVFRTGSDLWVIGQVPVAVAWY